MTVRWRFLLGICGWGFVALFAALFALSAWAIAPFSHAPHQWVRTAGFLVRAPAAHRIVIGDSRVRFAAPPPGSLFVGYGGATARHLERVAAVLCRLTDARVTIALGVNDSKPTELDLPSSRAALRRIAEDCARESLWLAQIWPTEPGVEPGGDAYHAEAIASLNRYLGQVARRTGAKVVEVPELHAGFTYDGVHFTQAISRDYARRLAFPERLTSAD